MYSAFSEYRLAFSGSLLYYIHSESLFKTRPKQAMTTELTLMGSKNRTTQEFFVFIETCDRNQIRLINPAGKILTVPQHIFESPVAVHATQFDTCFTAEQLSVAEKVKKSGGKDPGPKKKTVKKATKKVSAKTGLGITWSAPTLTFYKFKIDPLSDKQSFRIEMENGETFQITKAEFQSVFADIILSNEYSQEGSFSFPEMPSRAVKFLASSK
jgi:hypothetical protein